MKIYESKYNLLPGSAYAEVIKAARREYHHIQKRTPRRQPYVRSKYFTKEKIFISEFWQHLDQKIWPDRVRRMKLFICAIDLIRNTTYDPEIKQSTTKPSELLYRFSGKTNDGQLFYVQIRENKRTQRKDFTSVFPG
jgi:hypothetical protein